MTLYRSGQNAIYSKSRGDALSSLGVFGNESILAPGVRGSRYDGGLFSSGGILPLGGVLGGHSLWNPRLYNGHGGHILYLGMVSNGFPHRGVITRSSGFDCTTRPHPPIIRAVLTSS